MKIKITPTEQTEAVVKRMFHLAWKASRVLGMGVFQDRGPQITEDQVWTNIMGAHDYKFDAEHEPVNKPAHGEPYADYVFGRMMKMGLRYKDGIIHIYRDDITPDYQSWCITYPSYLSLVDHACEQLHVTFEQID